jgi:hypothetical protein
LEPLARAIEAGPCGDLTFIVGEKSRLLTKDSFGNSFGSHARRRVNKSAHGVPKLAATRAANNGASGSDERHRRLDRPDHGNATWASPGCKVRPLEPKTERFQWCFF